MRLPEPLIESLERAASMRLKTVSEYVREVLTEKMLSEQFLTPEQLATYMQQKKDEQKISKRRTKSL